MEKVKVTKRESELIDSFKEDFKMNFYGMDFVKFVSALKDGYEVEPEFKVGDWVLTKVTNHIGKITGFSNITNYYDIEGIQTDNIRHATPEEIAEEKERRWWKKHGREPWGLKKYDRIKCKTTDKEYEILDVEKPLRFKVLDMRDVHLRNIEFYSTQQISSRFVVVCFTENRLDVKTND